MQLNIDAATQQRVADAGFEFTGEFRKVERGEFYLASRNSSPRQAEGPVNGLRPILKRRVRVPTVDELRQGRYLKLAGKAEVYTTGPAIESSSVRVYYCSADRIRWVEYPVVTAQRFVEQGLWQVIP